MQLLPPFVGVVLILSPFVPAVHPPTRTRTHRRSPHRFDPQSGYTPLMLAARNGDVPTARLLLLAGIDKTAKNRFVSRGRSVVARARAEGCDSKWVGFGLDRV